MRFKRRLMPQAVVDLVPMIDVVFQLVIFFMVSSTFILTPGISLVLPGSSTSEPVAMSRLVVTIISENEIYLNKEKYNISGLDKKYDLIIVSFHGGAEGKNAQHVLDSTETFLGENRGNVFAFAHTVIDAGADLVIGHGPHVLRAVEIYKQKLIAYSLGNFLTYGNINTGGISGIAVILDVEIDSTNGNFVRGKLLPVKQVGYGIPEYDINNEGINLIRSLTENDFPGTKLLITPDGKIYYTGFGKISFRFFDDGKEDVFEIHKVKGVKLSPLND